MCSKDQSAKTQDEPSTTATKNTSSPEWCHAVSELKEVDRVIAELRKELSLAQREREITVRRLSSLRVFLVGQGHSVDELNRAAFAGDQPMGSKVVDLDDDPSDKPNSSNPLEPEIYRLDERSNSGSRPASMEDWEQGLEVIERHGTARTTGSRLKMHLLKSSSTRGFQKT